MKNLKVFLTGALTRTKISKRGILWLIGPMLGIWCAHCIRQKQISDSQPYEWFGQIAVKKTSKFFTFTGMSCILSFFSRQPYERAKRVLMIGQIMLKNKEFFIFTRISCIFSFFPDSLMSALKSGRRRRTAFPRLNSPTLWKTFLSR